jgi:hypothetical protein
MAMPRRLRTRFALACASILCGGTVVHAATLTLAWDPDGAGATGYILSYGTQSGVYTQHINVGNQTQYAVTGLADGTTYYFVVQAYNAVGTSDPSVEVVGQTGQPTVTSMTVTANHTAPQPPNTPIIFTATPTGGVQPYAFKWWLNNGGGWTAVSVWTQSNTYAWTPTVPNASYALGAWVKSAGNPADAPEFGNWMPFPISGSGPGPVTGMSVTADRSAPQPPSTTIHVTAAPTGGVQPYQFKWWVYDGNTWAAVGGWTQNSVFTWTPAGANPNYRVGAWVKSAGNPADAPEFGSWIPFPITSGSGRVTGDHLATNLSAPQPAGTTITITATPVGGIQPYLFQWWLFDGHAWARVGGWTQSNTFTWTPTVPNPNYAVGPWVKSAGNPADAPEFGNWLPFAIR